MFEVIRETLVPGSIEELEALNNGVEQSVAPSEQGAQTVVMSYKEFKRLSPGDVEQIPVGTLVRDVKANELYTLQDWMDPKKISWACADFVDGKCITQAKGYARNVGNRPALILGDGNHRAGIVLANDFKSIDVVTVLPAQPLNPASIRPLRAVVRRYWDICKPWGD